MRSNRTTSAALERCDLHIHANLPQCAEKTADAALRINGHYVAQMQEAGGAHHFVTVVMMIEHVHDD